MLSLDLSLSSRVLRRQLIAVPFRISLDGMTYERLELADGIALTLPNGEALYVRIF